MANYVIEEAGLPMRQGGQNRFGQNTLKHPDPLYENEIGAACDKQMYMIRHEHIPAHGDVAAFGFKRKTNKSLVHDRPSQEFPPMVCIERHKVNWRIVRLKDSLQARRPIRHPRSVML